MREKARAGSRSDLRFHIPPPEDGSDVEATAQVAALTREFHGRLDEWARGAAERAELRERRRKALLDAVGEDAVERFRSYSREQRQSNYGLGPIRPDREGLGRLNEARRAAHQGSFELMRELGVDAERVRAVHDEFGRDLMASTRAAGPPQGSPGDPSDVAAFGPAAGADVVGDVGPVIDPGPLEGGTGDGWSRRVPPFDGWSWVYSLSWRGGNEPLVRARAYTHGLIGSSPNWINKDAGDDDSLDLWSDCALGFWYYAPREGLIEVQARFAIAAFPVVMISLSDEWGWSGANLRLVNGVYVNVTPPGSDPHVPKTWELDIHGSPDSYASYHVDGPTYAIAQRTMGPVPGPGWVWIYAGTYSDMHIDLNDVSVHASIMAEWDVSEVLVRMA